MPHYAASRGRKGTEVAMRCALNALVVVLALLPVASAGASRPLAGATLPLERQVDAVFGDFDSTVSPGCALAVFREGRTLYRRGYGMADLDHDVPITPATPFHVASVSKQFTAAAVLLLGQEGKLSLDDDVRRYVPELPDFGNAVTLRQMIHHTSGLRDQWDMLGLAGWRYSLDLITDEDVLSVVSRQRGLNFHPGERFLYCNTGYTLLAQVVKNVSGRSFREFTDERIFHPLGMERTHFRDDHAEVVRGQALGYTPASGPSPFRLSVTNFDTVGATSLVTTAEDLGRWDSNFDDPRVGGPELVRSLVEPGRLADGTPTPYAAGLVLGRYRGLRTVGHGGSDAGYRAYILRFPDERVTIACLCNLSTADPTTRVRQVADVLLAGRLGPPDVTTAATEPRAFGLAQDRLAALTGLYWSREEQDSLRVVLKGGALYAVVSPEASYELRPTGESTFRFVGPLRGARFEKAAGGRLTMIASWDNDPRTYAFEHVEPARPAPEELRALAGSYRSEEIDPVYRIDVADGGLVLRRLKAKPDTLEPIVADIFKGSVGVLRFERSPANDVSGFILSTGRVRNMRFERVAP